MEWLRVVGISHISNGLYIGGARAVYRAEELQLVGITRVLKLYPDDPFWPEDFQVCEAVLHDGQLIPPGLLRRGTAFLREPRDDKEAVLVVCGAGISRSATFVLAYLLEEGYDLRAAWTLLQQQHPSARPHPQMWLSLVAEYNLGYSLEELAHFW
ncbi:MAG: dual specificity protein phosphatase family protein [Ardenticatenales bacterium]|nr:dual specificity protein phosphatase family protein [Ardenticatenales bacterium]